MTWNTTKKIFILSFVFIIISILLIIGIKYYKGDKSKRKKILKKLAIFIVLILIIVLKIKMDWNYHMGYIDMIVIAIKVILVFSIFSFFYYFLKADNIKKKKLSCIIGIVFILWIIIFGIDYLRVKK